MKVSSDIPPFPLSKFPHHSLPSLKVPKHEIFDRSDFPDFYTIKKYYLIVLIFERAKPRLVSDAHAEHTGKELMRMLSIRIRA